MNYVTPYFFSVRNCTINYIHILIPVYINNVFTFLFFPGSGEDVQQIFTAERSKKCVQGGTNSCHTFLCANVLLPHVRNLWPLWDVFLCQCVQLGHGGVPHHAHCLGLCQVGHQEQWHITLIDQTCCTPSTSVMGLVSVVNFIVHYLSLC